MKKVLAILAIAGVFAACNNDANDDDNQDTLTTIPVDTNTIGVPYQDTTVFGDTTGRGLDTTNRY